MYCQDVAMALQGLGFLKVKEGKVMFSVDWSKVDAHAERVAKSKTRITIDPECLRWTPLLTTAVNPFREDKSDGEKDGDRPTETADIIVPMPEKIIIETHQGVKMRKGRKRKVSTTRRTQKTPRNEKVTPSYVDNGNTTTEEQEVETTSSGRRRTRPSKFNETTYADVKLKSSDKRKRNESMSEKEAELEKKRSKVEPAEKKSLKQVNTETPKATVKEPNATVTRSRRTAAPAEKIAERWSQRRKRILDKQEEKKEEAPPETPKVKPIIEESQKEPKEPEIPESLPPPPPPPAVTEVKRARNRKKKRGWVKGRSRSKPMKQLTLPDFIKQKQDTESEVGLSDKSEDEVKLVTKDVPEKPVEEIETKVPEEEVEKTSRISAEEDSSAEADDEMEKEELVPKRASPNLKKNKYVQEKQDVVAEEEKTENTKEEEKVDREVERKEETEIIATNRKTEICNEVQPQPVVEAAEVATKENKETTPGSDVKPGDPEPQVVEDSTSESETEIDGQKIKIISQKEILEISKQTPVIVDQQVEKKEEEPVQKSEKEVDVVMEKPPEPEPEPVPVPQKHPETTESDVKTSVSLEPVTEEKKVPEKEEVVPKIEEAPAVVPEAVPVIEETKKPEVVNQVVEKVEPKPEEKQKKSVATETDSKLLEKPEKKPKPEVKPIPPPIEPKHTKPKEEIKVLPKQETPPKVETKPPKLPPEKCDDKRCQQKHEDLKPKIPTIENESLLAKPEYAMTSASNYMAQAQYAQWQWPWDKGIYFDPKRDYQGYTAMPLHIPPIDVLPKQHQPTEKEKSALKMHRHESKQSLAKSKEGSKNSPKKDEKVKAKVDSDVKPAGGVTKPCVTQQSVKAVEEKPKVSTKPAEAAEENVHRTEVTESIQQPATPVQTSVKQTPPTPSASDIPSMGVYTPDSTTNSVHSLHYGQCDIEIGQLGLESPTSISSDMASQNSVEAVRPPSVVPQQHTPQQPPPPPANYDCSVMQNTMQQQQQQQNIAVPASSPMQQQQQQQQQQPTKRQIQQQRRSNTPKQQSVRSTPPVQPLQRQQQRTTPPQTPHQHAMQQAQHNIAMQQHHQQQLQAAAAVAHHQVAMHQGYGHHHQLGGTAAMHQHAHHPHHHSVISQGNYIPVPQVRLKVPVNCV